MYFLINFSKRPGDNELCHYHFTDEAKGRRDLSHLSKATILTRSEDSSPVVVASKVHAFCPLLRLLLITVKTFLLARFRFFFLALSSVCH